MTKQNIAQWLVILALILQGCGGQVSASPSVGGVESRLLRGYDVEAGVVCWSFPSGRSGWSAGGIHCMKISETGLAK